MICRVANVTFAAVALLAAAASGTAFSQSDAAAGRFIAVTGEVKIVGADGVTRGAVRGGEFRQGESIVTGPDALAQVRMTDGGALSVRAESQLKLEGYRFRGNDDPEPSFFASLIKGGFRTITGLIGRNRRDSYRVATTSATMGIRGTHFEIVHVVQPLPDAAPGTYNRVYDGIVAIRNRAGAELLVTRDQTVFVALPGNVAPVLVRPPAGIYSKPTPVPVFKPQARDASDAAAHKDKVAPREALRGGEKSRAILAPRTAQPVESSPTLSSPLLTPIDTPTTISPTLTAPTTTIISPTTTTISPTLTAPTTTTLSPTTTTISPTTTTLSPTTTTISPTLISPTTTTISPTTTTISPITTTISPTTTTISPTTTTISPTLTAPTTTTIIKR
ncbi:MAG TPA: FecR domain-containing protein [Burkholderiales bacterium]|nr:FecR domain-containing protein [Burkholderiales bacterium]